MRDLGQRREKRCSPASRAQFDALRFCLTGHDAVYAVYHGQERGGLAHRAGRGRSTRRSVTTRPGSLSMTTMRSAINTASSMLCVTIRIALGGDIAVKPQLQQLAAQRFGAEHVERRERLVETQQAPAPPPSHGQTPPSAASRRIVPADTPSQNRPSPPGRAGRASCDPLTIFSGTPRALRATSTFSCTVSHGNRREASGKRWSRADSRPAAARRGTAPARRSGRCSPADDAQQRALAAARWPQERQKFAIVDDEVDILHRSKAALAAAVDLVDPPQLGEEQYGSGVIAHSIRYRSSASRYSRRHTSRLMTATVTIRPACLPAAADSCPVRWPRRSARRCRWRRYVLPPNSTYSATMLAFHAPPAAVIMPVTR